MDVSDDMLDGWEALAAAGSSGPWRAEGVLNDEVWADDGLVADTMSTSTGSAANAEFIAAAREGWPATIAALREVRAERDEARAEVERLREGIAKHQAAAEAPIENNQAAVMERVQGVHARNRALWALLGSDDKDER